MDDDTSRWFAWIPILTPELLIDYPLHLLRNSTEKTCELSQDPQDIYVTPDDGTLSRFDFPDDYRNAVRQQLQCEDSDQIYFSIRRFGDTKASTPKRYAFRLDRFGYVKATGIGYTQGFSGSQPLASIAFLGEIDSEGLFSYTLWIGKYPPDVDFPKEQWAATIARYHFEIVRDVYHEHVYTPGGDFALFPVQASNRVDALNLLCRQYSEMVLDYHKVLKEHIRESFNEGWIPYHRYLERVRAGIHGRGHLAYCGQLHKLFKAHDHGACIESESTFANAERSLGLQQQELESVCSGKILSVGQQLTYWLASTALLISIVALLNSDVAVKSWCLITKLLLSAVCVLCVWLIYWYVTLSPRTWRLWLKKLHCRKHR